MSSFMEGLTNGDTILEGAVGHQCLEFQLVPVVLLFQLDVPGAVRVQAAQVLQGIGTVYNIEDTHEVIDRG